MNTQRLLDEMEALGDDQQTIQQLRKLIVALAVGGKLDSLRPTASDTAAMTELSEIGSAARVGEANLPQGFSSRTNFVRLGAVARIEKGLTAIARAKPGQYPLVVTAEKRGSCDHFDFDCAAAIVPLVSSAGHGKASLHRLHYQEGRFAVGSILAAVVPLEPDLISARFLFEYLSAFKEELLVSKMIGTANVSLSISKIAEVPVPMVVPATQKRMDELMVLCDELDAVRVRREAVRDGLAAAMHARLNVTGTEELRGNAPFVLDTLPAITARRDQLKQLRQTILNLAVRGTLVPQDRDDEPASELLKQIAAEKARAGLKPSVPAPPVHEPPFNLPDGWSWSRIGEICTKTGSGSTPRGGKEIYKDAGVPFLRSQNVYDDGLRLDDVAYIDAATHVRMVGTTVRPGDLLLNITGGSMGRCCRVTDDFAEANVSQHVAIIRVAVPGVEDFLHLVVLSPYFQAFIFDEQTGAGRGGLPKNRMDNIVVALPPLAEQRRIVDKVDELMTLCDRLESNLKMGDETRRRSLEALLHEVLVPRVATDARA